MSIRTEILAYLELRQTATAADLSRALQVTAANVRHHLRNLERDGIVQPIGKRPSSGRGRPSRVFRLARRGADLTHLTEAILDELLAGASREASGPSGSPRQAGRLPLVRVAARLAGGSPLTPAPASQRLLGAIQRLNELGYQSHWEAHATGPRIILGNCPYAEIISDHPELCQMDGHLLEILADRPATQSAKLERNQQGLPVCIFRLVS